MFVFLCVSGGGDVWVGTSSACEDSPRYCLSARVLFRVCLIGDGSICEITHRHMWRHVNFPTINKRGEFVS